MAALRALELLALVAVVGVPVAARGALEAVRPPAIADELPARLVGREPTLEVENVRGEGGPGHAGSRLPAVTTCLPPVGVPASARKACCAFWRARAR